MKRPLLCLLACAMLASCAHPKRPARPQVTPSSVPSTPTASPSKGPYGYIYTAPPLPPNAAVAAVAGPEIKEIDLNDRVLSAPGPVRVRVLTNPMVSSVIVRTLGHELALPQQAPGVFGADDELPSVPFFLRHREYRVDFAATTPDGRSAVVTLPITLR